MKKILILLLLFFSIALSCERDDICPETTVTTPRLIIDFLDLSNQDDSKTVTNFRAEDANDNTKYLSSYSGSSSETNAILPLKTTEDTTTYILYNNYGFDDDDNQTGNPDTITISYVREYIYVSRACGYKTNYKNVTITVEDDGDNWIELITAVNDNLTIENETTTHFNLLH